MWLRQEPLVSCPRLAIDAVELSVECCKESGDHVLIKVV